MASLTNSSKIMTGARALVQIADPNGKTATVGWFNSVSYGLAYDVATAYVLGRYSPAELTYTSQEAIRVSASGWRVIGHGAHEDAAMPLLQDLLLHEYIQIALVDRQTGVTFATIHSVRPESYSTGISNRTNQEISVTFLGMLIDEEGTTNAETVTSVGVGDLP